MGLDFIWTQKWACPSLNRRRDLTLRAQGFHSGASSLRKQRAVARDRKRRRPSPDFRAPLAGDPEPGDEILVMTFRPAVLERHAHHLVARWLFEAHSSALDIVFYDGAQFPAEYKGNTFVALKGSWNRAEPERISTPISASTRIPALPTLQVDATIVPDLFVGAAFVVESVWKTLFAPNAVDTGKLTRSPSRPDITSL
jgi:hypothetical protein